MATPHHAPTEGDQRLQDFWDQASHDLRQPVQSLQLLAQIFARHAETPQMREGAGHMRRVVQDLAGMHEALVQLSLLECGRTPPDRRPVALDRLATDIVGELAAPARERNVALRTRGLDLSPEADAAWLAVILRGLILFALRHCEGDEVAITGRPRRSALSVAIEFQAADIPAREAASVFLEATGPEQRHAVLGPGYLGRLCALLGYGLNLRAGKPGRQAFMLTFPPGSSSS